jgi:phosphatidate cytidylyltransferase
MFSSLKDRSFSAGIIILFLGAVVVFNSIFPLALNIAIALISAASMYEIALALGVSKKPMLLWPTLIFACVLPFLSMGFQEAAAYFLYTVVVFSTMIFYHDLISFREVGVLYSVALLIPTSLETLIQLRHIGGRHGMFYVIVAIFAAWLADVGAYFAGNWFGKHKLCPNISPKKTVEGVIGGFIFEIGMLLLAGWFFQDIFWAGQAKVSYFTLFVIGVGGSALSVIGDLSFSLIKRSCHIKDFSEILPGHGGILDRFDSVIFVAPFVSILLRFMPLVYA